MKRLLQAIAAAVLLGGAWLAIYAYSGLAVDTPVQFSLKQGSSLRSVTFQMQAAGVLDSPLQFEILARLLGDAGRIKAGNYEIPGKTTMLQLLRKITSGDVTLDQITFIEGWTFERMRTELNAQTALRHDTLDMPVDDLMRSLGSQYPSPEGLFFPDTYYFAAGTSDLEVLTRAYRAMQTQLDTLWQIRAGGLPLENSYQALILASIIEKETGQSNERPMIAAVFVNRLKRGMKLQTDPTVIYGLGAQFDGNLRKRDLLADGPYNTYLRTGLPPTPIALPGLGALTAALNPANSTALYFVAKGDGTSQFSDTLSQQEQAVIKYQKGGNY